MTAAFVLQGVSKHYPQFSINDLSLTLPAGQIMGLVGVNGAGKSTLLRLLTGLAAPSSGEIEVLGHRLPQAQVAAKRSIGFAAEDMRLYRGQTLDWHIELVRRIYPEWDSAYAASLMRRFDLRADQPIGGFSHGQRVKALLLLCLARRPQLLLLDEPTTGLDPVARAEVLEALAEVLRDEHRSVLFSSHNTHDIEQLSDSISFMHQGRLLASADKERFVDEWRRVLCVGEVPEAIDQWPELVQRRAAGSQVELRFRRWQDDLPERLTKVGLNVQRIDPMALEDIFVTTVRAGAVR